MSAAELGQAAIDALALGSLYGLFALGIALIFGVMGLLNFAHGELVMVGAYGGALLGSAPFPVAIVTIIVVVALFALAMERVAFRPVRNATPATLLTTSFAVSFALQNLASIIFGTAARPIHIGSALQEPVAFIGLTVQKLDLVTVAVTVVLLLSLTAFLTRTWLGLQLRAAAEDFQMARLLGVRANTVIMAGFAIAGVLAATASILVGIQTGFASPAMGLNIVMVAFIATIVGGMGSLSGAVLGGYGLGILTVALQTALPPDVRPYRDALVFAFILVVLVVRPEGLFPGRGAEHARSY